MSEFHRINYRGVVIEAFPCGIRKIPIFRHLPFWTTQKVRFTMRILNPKDKRFIQDIPIVKKNSSESWHTKLEENEDCILNSEGNEITIKTSGLYGSDILEYYIGIPNFEGSVRIVEIQANWKDKIWFAIFSIVGSILIVLFGWLLGFIEIVPYYQMYGK